LNITVVEGDLLDQDVDVIVNAWNRNIIPWWLLLPQGDYCFNRFQIGMI